MKPPSSFFTVNCFWKKFLLIIFLLFSIFNNVSAEGIITDCINNPKGNGCVRYIDPSKLSDRCRNSSNPAQCVDNEEAIKASGGVRESDVRSRNCVENSGAALKNTPTNTASQERIYDCGSNKGFRCVGNSGSDPLCREITVNSREICTGGVSIANCLSDIADFVVGGIFKFVNIVLSFILGIAGWILDVVIYATVVKFRTNLVDLNLTIQGSVGVSNPITGTEYNTGTISTGNALGQALFGDGRQDLIYYIWGILRDFVNILLLITIIYFAVMTMFDGFDNNTRKKFIWLLLFSIVVNFSLFFIKFAIDISNILTLQAYTLMVNPKGLDTWENFRNRVEPMKPATLGEYMMNVSDVGKIFRTSVAEGAAQQRVYEGMKKSWVFQVGMALVYLGLIYLVFFLVGFLVVRAGALVLSMVLAALLVADIFFEKVVGDENGNTYEFVSGIRKVTSKIKDDFYEALVRPPVLLFFLFLVGILSNAIFSQATVAEVTNLALGSDEFKIMGSAFGQSITVLLKFGIFFALSKVLFDKLANIKIGSGGSWVNKGSAWIANKTLGSSARWLGYAGQNTIGRVTTGDNIIGRNLTRFNNAQWVQNWKNADGGTIIGKGKRLIGGGVVRGIKGIRTGTYDAGNLISTINTKTGGRVLSAIQNTLGKDSKGGKIDLNLDFGKRVTDTFEARDAAAAKRRQDRRDAEVDAAGDGELVDINDGIIAARNVKVKGAGNVSLELVEQALSGKVSAMRGSPLETFINNYKSGDAKTMLEMKERREEAGRKADRIVKDRMESRQGNINEEYLRGDRKAETYFGMVSDVASGRGLGAQRAGLKVDTAAKSKKESQTEVKKYIVLTDTKRDLEATIKDIDATLSLGTASRGGIIPDTEFNKLSEVRDKILDDISKLALPLGNPADDIKEARVSAFAKDKDLRGSVIKNKNDAANLIGIILDPSNTTASGIPGKSIRQAIVDARHAASDAFEVLKDDTEKAAFLTRLHPTRGGLNTLNDYKAAVRASGDAAKKMERLSSEGLKIAQEISSRAEKRESAIKAQFEPKEEVKPKP